MKKLEYHMSARRHYRTYLVLAFGTFFMWAGLTVDPATNCDASGRQCAPWLVYVALGMGVLAVAAGVGLWGANRRWGSRLDLAQHRLLWWENAMSEEPQSIALHTVSKIKVQHHSESSDRLFFYDQVGVLIRFTEERAVPYHYETWARDLATHYPHIKVEVEEA